MKRHTAVGLVDGDRVGLVNGDGLGDGVGLGNAYVLDSLDGHGGEVTTETETNSAETSWGCDGNGSTVGQGSTVGTSITVTSVGQVGGVRHGDGHREDARDDDEEFHC